MSLKVLGIVLAPVGAVLMLLGGWWPFQMGTGAMNALRAIGYVSPADAVPLMAFILTPAGAAVLATSFALVTWPGR